MTAAKTDWVAGEQVDHLKLNALGVAVNERSDRANHTGQQPSTTISDFTEAAQDAIAALLVGASGVTLSYNDTANTLTITGGGAAGLDVEAVRDAIGVALVGAGNISVLVNDAADTITITTTATQNSTDAQLRDRGTHTGTQSADTLTDGATNRLFSSAEKSKLAGVAANATQNASDAALRDRATHTGQQTSASISDFTEAVQDAVGAFLGAGSNVVVTYDDTANTLTIASTGGGTGGLDAETVRDVIGAAIIGVGNITVAYNDALDTITVSTSATVNSTDAALRDRGTHTGSQSIDTITESGTGKVMTAAERTKLGNVAAGATANATDAQLRDRSTHTGSQTASTISDFAEAVDDRVGALLADGTGIDVVYNDAGNVVTINATGGGGSAATSYVALVGAMAADSVNTITHGLNNWNVDVVLTRSYLQSGALTAAVPGEVVRDIRWRKTGPNTIVLEPSIAVAANEFIVAVNPSAAPADTTGPTAGVLSSPAQGISTIDLVLTGGSDAGIGAAGVNWFNNGVLIAQTAGDAIQVTGLTSNSVQGPFTAKRFDYFGTEGPASNSISPSTQPSTNPPLFDAVTQGPRLTALANTTGSTFTHTGAGSNLGGVLAIVDTNEFAVSATPQGTPTASYGGVALVYLGTILMGNTASAGFVSLFKSPDGVSLPTGPQSVIWSMSAAGQTFGSIYPVMTTFSGVGSIGPMASTFQSTTGRSVAVPSSLTNTVWGLIADRYTGAAFTGRSFTDRKTQTANTPDFTCGEQASAATSTTVSATGSIVTEGVAVGVEIRHP